MRVLVTGHNGFIGRNVYLDWQQTLGVNNVESPNPLDAGLRVILPGSNTSENTYYVRVRSGGSSTWITLMR